MGVAMQPVVYHVENLEKQYTGRAVVQIARVEVVQGEVLCLVGPTGAGKSTLLRLLAALERPTSGVLRFGLQQRPIADIPLAERRQIAMLFQRPLLLHGTVQANVEYGLRLRRIRRYSEKARGLLNQLRLGEIAQQPALTLSGGQIQLVALARALAVDPQVLLLDEPTAHLDPAHVALVEEVVREYQRRVGATIVWATHNLFQARRVADRVALLLDGQLIEVARAATFFETPADPRTAAFVNGKMIY
ncbi:MAG TPA: ATP-binding cassette domain-containing protein [Gemmataceae bacterium]|nr:ATP-binding cassette domain-containing protein [Gemmataceae bacterium]